MTPNPSLPAAPVEAVVPSDEQIDAAIAFSAKRSWLSHPDVPWRGTANGDSTDAWTRRYWTALFRSAFAAPPAVLVEPSVVMWQYRHADSPEWEELKIRNAYTDTIEQRVAEIREYIAGGYKYELRALVAAPAVPLEQPAGRNVYPDDRSGKFPDAADEDLANRSAL